MDMLYSRYSNPLDLMRIYINQGRFGAFVEGFLSEEADRITKERERYNDMKLWMAYVHSMSKQSYSDWKNSVLPANRAAKGNDESLDDDGIKSIIDRMFPKSSNGGEK